MPWLASGTLADAHSSPSGYWLHQRPIIGALLLYLLLSSALAHSLPIGEMVKAGLALPAVVLVPLLIGHALLRLSPVAHDISGLPGESRALVEWLAGSLTLVVLAVALHLAGRMLLLERIGWLALGLTSGALVMTLRRPAKVRLGLDVGVGLALAGAILFAMTPKLIAAQSTPFPLLAGNFLDALHFAQPAARLIDHGYLMLDNPSHAPGIVVLTAVQSQLYGVQPLSFLWMGPFALFAVFGAGLLLWGRAASHRWSAALLVTAVGLYILTGPAALSGTPLALRSNRLLFAVFPLALFMVHRLLDDGRPSRRAKVEALVAMQGVAGILFLIMSTLGMQARIPMMAVAGAMLGFALVQANRRRWHWTGMPALVIVIVAFQVFHVYEAPVYLTGLIVYGLALTLRGVRFEEAATVAAVAAVSVFFLLQYAGVLSFPRDFSLSSLVLGDAYAAASFGFAQRIALLDSVLAPVVIVLLLLGAAACITNRAGPSGRAVLIAAAAMFFVYLLPDPFAYRTNKGMVPFLAVLTVAGAGGAGSYLRQLLRTLGGDRPLVQELAQIGLVAAALPALLMPFLNSVSAVRPGETHHSVIARIEYELAGWFSDHTGENVRIVSDYQTMLVLSSLSNKISLSERHFLPSELREPGLAQMRAVRNSVLAAADGCSAYSAVRSLAGSEPPRERRFLRAIGADGKEPEYYVVWTAKTFLWAEQEETIAPIRTATGDVYPTMIMPFLDSRFFRLEATLGNQAYVFRVLPAPEDPVQPSEGPAPELLSQILGVSIPPGGRCAWSP